MDALPFINSTNHVPGWWQLALIAMPVWMLIAQIRKRRIGDRNHQSNCLVLPHLPRRDGWLHG